jgi:hypothetical protein
MFTRKSDDECAYKQSLKQSTGTLSFIMDPNKYYSCKPCRISEGIVGGNNVSVFKGNLVDLESDLRGQTRKASKCPGRLFAPGTVIEKKLYGNCPDGCTHGDISGIACVKNCQANLNHLNECNIINHRPKVKTTGIYLDTPVCPAMKPVLRQTQKQKSKPKVDMFWQGQQGLYQ